MVVSVVCSAGGYADATHTVEFIIEAEQTTTSAGCTTLLGALGSRTIMQPGAWSADDGCASSQRGKAQTPYYARSYTFSLGEAAEVTIDLSSVRDTFLYVLSGHGASGTRLHYNDDASSSTFDSRLSVELAAVRYTIEATTYSARTAGSFTLTVVTDIEDDPEPPVAATVSGLAPSYDATVDELLSFMFDFEPSGAVPSVRSVSLTGLDLSLARRGGTATVEGTPTHAGHYEVVFALTQGSRTDTHTTTIDADCPDGYTQLSDRSCVAPVCWQSLGRGVVGSSVLELQGSGSWESGCELPAGRMGRRVGTFYAKHYTFTLLYDARVTIDLTSRDQDTYLFLLEGYGAHGDEVDHDDDGGAGLNSKLANVSLDAGGYTVTSSTYRRERTGDFEVRLDAYVPLTVTGLNDTDHAYRATGRSSFSTGFTYRPAAAEFSVRSVTPAGLRLTPADLAGGHVGLAGTPTRAATYTVTLAFTQGSRTDTRTIEIIAACPTVDTTAPDGTCIAAGTRPAVAAGCVTTDRPGWWGRIVHSGRWTPGCASIQTPASAARYYRLDVTTPGRFAGGNLPVKIELTSDPAASMYMLAGSDPNTARLMRFGSPADRSIVSGSTYGLPLGSYLIEVATSQPFVAGASNNFSLAVQRPTGSEQHRDVQLIGNTGLDGDGLSLADFISRHPDDTPGPDTTPVYSPDTPYLDWHHDGCGGHQHLEWNTNALPLEKTELLQRFESACMRHDFNWQNLKRIERDVDPSVDAWNQTAKDESDTRLADDLISVCRSAIGNTLFQDVDAYVSANRECEAKAFRITSLVRGINP